MYLSNWFVCQTRPTFEFRAQLSLRRLGIGSYVPSWKQERRHRRTKQWRIREHLAIPGYVFIELPYIEPTPRRPLIRFEDWMAIKMCEGIREVLGLPQDDGGIRPFPIPSRLMERLIAAQANQEWDQTRAAQLRRGELAKNRREDARLRFHQGAFVKAVDGPFRTFSGEVTGVTSAGQVTALINLLGRLVPAAFPPDWLEVVEKERDAA